MTDPLFSGPAPIFIRSSPLRAPSRGLFLTGPRQSRREPCSSFPKVSSTLTSFDDFGLAAPLLRALQVEGYTQPTPIQGKAIPDVMAGRDLLGIAQTGTGKTAAFALPILHRLAAAPKHPGQRRCRALVLSPTRELASQIADSFRVYGRNLKLTTAVIFGGVPLGKQERTLAGGVDILVATPGRLLDLIDRRSLSLAGVEILVLDEADQMLDLGFIHALRRIVTLLPAKRQSLFFSATMPNMIAGLADQLLRDPVKVSVTPVATTAERVEQSVIFVSTNDKQALLARVLSAPDVERTLVFSRTKHGADRIVRNLERDGIAAAAIHGNKSQGQRERALAGFKNGACRVLVATDIAARGIDVEGVSHVLNFDLPNVPESYVHRIGRTARAGKTGVAISFCNGEERAYLRDIEKLTRLKVPVAPFPDGFVPGSAPDRAEPPAERGGRDAPSRSGAGRGPSRPHGQGQRAGGHRPPQGGHDGRPGGQPGRDRRPAAVQAKPQGQARPRPTAQHQGGGGGRDGSNLSWLSAARRSPER